MRAAGAVFLQQPQRISGNVAPSRHVSRYSADPPDCFDGRDSKRLASVMDKRSSGVEAPCDRFDILEGWLGACWHSHSLS
jgi:hypothetical protein